MHPSCLHGPGSLYGLVAQTTLLYKEGPEVPGGSWRQQPADSPELFCLGPGAAARNLAAGECGASW
jgi:hypothetical protein